MPPSRRRILPEEPDLIEQLEETTRHTPPTDAQKRATAGRAARLMEYFGSVAGSEAEEPTAVSPSVYGDLHVTEAMHERRMAAALSIIRECLPSSPADPTDLAREGAGADGPDQETKIGETSGQL